jgi:hypothetical protein
VNIVLTLLSLLLLAAPLRVSDALDGNRYVSFWYRGEVPTAIHRAVREWVADCLGNPEPAYRFAGWATAEQILGVSPDALGVQPYAVTEFDTDDRSAVIIVRRGRPDFWYTLSVLSHEFLHVITGLDDPDPDFLRSRLRCEIRNPFPFPPLPVLTPDSVAKLVK